MVGSLQMGHNAIQESETLLLHDQSQQNQQQQGQQPIVLEAASLHREVEGCQAPIFTPSGRFTHEGVRPDVHTLICGRAK